MSVPGDLLIQSTPLVDMTAFGSLEQVSGSVVIAYDAQLASLDGLGSLTSVGGELRIEQNASLLQVDGLASLARIGRTLWILDDPVLEDLAGLSSLTSLAEDASPYDPALGISGNTSLPACWVDVLEAQANVTCGYDPGTGWQACTGNDGTGSCGP